MKNFHLFLIILFGFLSIAIFILVAKISNWEDYIVASSLPHYKNSLSWKISATNGFPDGRPDADIETYIPNDGTHNNYKFVTEYSNQLENNKWKLDKSISLNKETDSDETLQSLTFIKKIGANTFKVEIYKYQWGKRKIEQYPNKTDRKRELIYIYRW
jgi:hypothetical protein